MNDIIDLEMIEHMETCEVCSLLTYTFCPKGKELMKPIHKKLLATGLFKSISENSLGE